LGRILFQNSSSLVRRSAGSLVEYYLQDIDMKGAWTGPGALDLHANALAPVAELPVLE
jgi:acetoacetate decarboxylase